MEQIFSEWSYFPDILINFLTSGSVWIAIVIGTIVGYIIGVLPGLGPTMGMSLSLSVVYILPPELGFALLCSILVAGIGSGGVTATMANIPGTASAAATCLDGYQLALQGKGREAIAVSIVASAIGTLLSSIVIFIIQPLVFTVALKLGDWEVFLFCVFGVMICGSLAGESPIKGLISGMLGLVFSMVGIDKLQAVPRLTLGISSLFVGFPVVPALLGLFGLSEVFFVLGKEEKIEVVGKPGWAIFRIKRYTDNAMNIIRSLFASMWIGFIPGVGESAACWFSYDIARRNAKGKEKELFGKGSFSGIIAAEVGNNASSIGALIPALSIGIPGSATTAIFLAAMYLMDYKPGPILLRQSPGILCELVVLLIMSSVMLVIIGFAFSKGVISLLSLPRDYLMPLIGALCIIGAWGTGFTKFYIIITFLFGVIGYILKVRNIPVAPMTLGLLIGDILDISLRRALTQYAMNPIEVFLRPVGAVTLLVLGILFYFSIRTNVSKQK